MTSTSWPRACPTAPSPNAGALGEALAGLVPPAATVAAPWDGDGHPDRTAVGLARRCARVTAFDVSPTAVGEARQSHAERDLAQLHRSVAAAPRPPPVEGPW